MFSTDLLGGLGQVAPQRFKKGFRLGIRLTERAQALRKLVQEDEISPLSSSVSRNDRFEFRTVKPDPPTLQAVIDLDIGELGAEERLLSANRTHSRSLLSANIRFSGKQTVGSFLF